MIAEAQDSSLEKALIRKVQSFFHHSGDTAVAKAAVEQIRDSPETTMARSH